MVSMGEGLVVEASEMKIFPEGEEGMAGVEVR
jgi:hypothetical protein